MPTYGPNLCDSTTAFANSNNSPPEDAPGAFTSPKWVAPVPDPYIWALITPTGGASTIVSMTLESGNDASERDPYNVILYGSNNGGVTLTTLTTLNAISFSGRNTVNTYNFSNSTSYTDYFWLCTRVLNGVTANDRFQIGKIKLWTGTSGGGTNVAVTPTLTASGQNLPFEGVAEAFNGGTGSGAGKWLIDNTIYAAGAQWYVGCGLTVASAPIAQYQVTSGNDAPGRDPIDWQLQGSNDSGATWTVADTRTGVTWSSRNQLQTFQFTNTAGSFALWRIAISKITDGLPSNSVKICQIGHIEMMQDTTPTTASYSFLALLGVG